MENGNGTVLVNVRMQFSKPLSQHALTKLNLIITGVSVDNSNSYPLLYSFSAIFMVSLAFMCSLRDASFSSSCVIKS